MADQLTTGPALDAAACQALHAALTAAGKLELAEVWEPQRASYEIGSGGEIPLEVIYPAISRDGNVMLRALEHMRELGYMAEFYMWPNGATGAPYSCRIRHAKQPFAHIYIASGNTAPEAVARAVAAALGGESEC